MSKHYMLGVCLAMGLLISAVILKVTGPTSVHVDQPVETGQSLQDKTRLATESLNPSSTTSSNLSSYQSVPPKALSTKDPSHEDEHLSQLTPQMRQAIQDQLLLHGPMTTQKNADGSVSLPTKGRYTQMPVAVQMPDGSIQVKEYSVIPD